MKTVLFFCLLLFAFTTTTLAQELLDVEGNLLENGRLYYIIPASEGKGGGLELAQTGSETCPLTVVQAPSEYSRGLPARLSSPLRILYLSPGLYLTIEFLQQKPSACLRHSKLQWKVDKESQVVRVASKEEEQLFGPFQIQPYKDAYKIVYCEGESEDKCKDLGISTDDENSRLLVVKNGEPLVVRFEKAHRSSNYARMSIV